MNAPTQGFWSRRKYDAVTVLVFVWAVGIPACFFDTFGADGATFLVSISPVPASILAIWAVLAPLASLRRYVFVLGFLATGCLAAAIRYSAFADAFWIILVFTVSASAWLLPLRAFGFSIGNVQRNRQRLFRDFSSALLGEDRRVRTRTPAWFPSQFSLMSLLSLLTGVSLSLSAIASLFTFLPASTTDIDPPRIVPLAVVMLIVPAAALAALGRASFWIRAAWIVGGTLLTSFAVVALSDEVGDIASVVIVFAVFAGWLSLSLLGLRIAGYALIRKRRSASIRVRRAAAKTPSELAAEPHPLD